MCLSAPCQNGGTCYKINRTTIACKCPDIFNGDYCENIIEQCIENLCQNGGWCDEINGNPYCECPSNFEGRYCENHIDFCSAQPCETGMCLNTAEGYMCQCPPGIIGRRCHLRPCDYMPCHKNAVCIDLLVFPASRNSYTCRCPKGLKGFDCTQIDNPCDNSPCRNNGRCMPLALRNIRIQNQPLVDEDVYGQFRCECPPYFYGEFCEILTTPDFVMEFNKSGTNDYVQMDGPQRNLNEVYICLKKIR